MSEYIFKLLGGVGERSEAEINVPFDLLVLDVKDLVRKTFKIAPNLSMDLMCKGKKLTDNQKWGMLDVKPSKDTILVIGHRE